MQALGQVLVVVVAPDKKKMQSSEGTKRQSFHF